MAKGKKEYSFKKCTVNVDEDQIIEHKGDGIRIHSLSKYLRELESKTDPIDFTLKSDSDVVPQETEGLSE
ncbi:MULTISPECIES: YonK family protein [Bacillus amyloliquefaciens group]|uniref:YonK family protein n=1 Tax=Bacillus amyloliquefaciens TaxID=1390 RepID=A0AAP3YGK5_BACAM|nr:YonK family protein [Bacillus amyloliquefaciens]MDF4194796.1 YonK family protein [Bacillus amyloliquefaciens]MDF4213177.1 YonK family protein [Bacillus amyloliquefaciens]